jgi:hypothetical protein
LEGKFELIYFHEHVHEGGLENKKIIIIDKILKIEGTTTTPNT